jgi:hypothetical protein
MLNQHDKNIHLFAPIAHPSQILFELVLTPRSHRKYMSLKMRLLLYFAGDRTNQIFSQTCDRDLSNTATAFILCDSQQGLLQEYTNIFFNSTFFTKPAKILVKFLYYLLAPNVQFLLLLLLINPANYLEDCHYLTLL